MVGSVPCRLSSEVHVDGCCVGGSSGNATDSQVQTATGEKIPKHARLMSREGREIVRPGYSAQAPAARIGATRGSMHAPKYIKTTSYREENESMQGVQPREVMHAPKYIKVASFVVVNESRQRTEIGGSKKSMQENKADNEIAQDGTVSESQPVKGHRGRPAPRWCPMGLSKTHDIGCRKCTRRSSPRSRGRKSGMSCLHKQGR
jgi:hypothetical protein